MLEENVGETSDCLDVKKPSRERPAPARRTFHNATIDARRQTSSSKILQAFFDCQKIMGASKTIIKSTSRGSRIKKKLFNFLVFFFNFEACKEGGPRGE